MTTILSHSIYYASTQTLFYNDLINTSTTTGNISRNRELVLFDLLDVSSKTIFRFPPLPPQSSCSQDAREYGLVDVVAAGRVRNLYQLIVDTTLHMIKKENLVEIQEGNIPFVLSIPHGGERKNIPHSFIIQRHLHYFSPAASASKTSEAASPSEEGEYTLIPMFANEPDTNTLELGAVLERHLIQLLNKNRKDDTGSDQEKRKLPLLRPYVVRANLHRQYCDLNRPPGRMSYDSLQGQVAHRYYHQQGLKACCDAVSKIYDSAFFMDLHGHPVDREEGDTVTFFRGTRNGLAWQKFLSREEERKRGAASLTGPWSVMGYLARLPPPTEISSTSSTSVLKTRYGVEPNITIESEARRVASIGVEQTMEGGFIVQTCGEDRNDTMQAIQLETGIDHRRTVEQQEQTGKDIAEAVNVFLKTYLSEEMVVAENKRRKQ